MALSDQDKRFLLALVYATGVVIFWRGIWGIADTIPILSNVFVSFFVGLLILTLTGLIFREFDPFGQQVGRITKLVHNVIQESKIGKNYLISYYDVLKKKHISINAKHVKHIEHNNLVAVKDGREVFIPIHRVSRIHKDKKLIWQH